MSKVAHTGALPSGREETRPEANPLERIGEALRGLRYGVVTVIVHDGVVVQVDRTEKLRLTTPKAKYAG